MTGHPRFSIVMPVYNGSEFLPRSVGSVLQQTIPDWQLLVVDDASTDGSPEIAAGLSAGDDRVTVIRLPENSGGPAVPRNRGIAESTGAIICFLDQDDEWHPDKLRIQDDVFDGRDDCVVYGDAYVGNEDGTTALYSELWGPLVGGDVRRQLIRGCFVPVLTVAVPRRILDHVGPFRAELAGVDDYDMWLRVAFAGYQFRPVVRPLATWHMHGRNLSFHHDLQLPRLYACLRTHRAMQPTLHPLFDERIERVRHACWRQAYDTFRHGPSASGAVDLLRLTRRRHEIALLLSSATRVRQHRRSTR